MIGLAVVLGGFAGADLSRRERALRTTIGPSTTVVVAARDLAAGEPLTPGRLTVRTVPRRYAPRDAASDPVQLVGLRPRVAIAAGHDVAPSAVDEGAGAVLRAGERIADIVAIGDAALVRPGVRVDVLVTRDGGDRNGSTRLALEDAEVVGVSAAPGDGGDAMGMRIAVALRVTVRQAVYLAAAQNFATELRVLPRSPDDDARGSAGLAASGALDGVR
jgi:pilus assembly protein CpaB